MPMRPPVHDPLARFKHVPVHKPKPDRQARRYLRTDSAQWRAIRKAQLERFPLCAYCNQPANEVDHIEGDTSKNLIGIDLQSLCKSCHSSKTMRDEFTKRTGVPTLMPGCDVRGMPLDPNHPWNRKDREELRRRNTGALPSFIAK